MKHLRYIFPLVVLFNFSNAQDTNPNEGDIAALIESRHFVFVAESASPLRGRTVFLSPGYTFTVSGDSLISNLPYYGRAYQATLDPNDAGIKFTSTDHVYNVKEKRKGWDISLKPNDVRPGPQMSLSVSSNGFASLRVTMVDRQSISFNGHVRKIQKK
jgi:hypothetical protein